MTHCFYMQIICHSVLIYPILSDLIAQILQENTSEVSSNMRWTNEQASRNQHKPGQMPDHMYTSASIW